MPLQGFVDSVFPLFQETYLQGIVTISRQRLDLDHFIAIVSNYEVGPGFEGDPHGTMEAWQAADPEGYDVPVLYSVVRAKVRRIGEGESGRYILEEYLAEEGSVD